MGTTFALEWRPAYDWVVCEVLSALTLALPQRPWTPGTRGVGSARTISNGSAEAFKLRRDELFRQRIRFWEDEWPGVRRMISDLQDNAVVCNVYPDQDSFDHYECYLIGPAMGEDVYPDRGDEGELGGQIFEIDLVWRTTNETVVTTEYYGEVGGPETVPETVTVEAGDEPPVTPDYADFFDDFETGDLAAPSGGFTWKLAATGHGAHNEVGAASGGGFALIFTYPSSVAGQDENNERRFDLAADGEEPQALWFDFDLHVPSNFDAAYEARSDRPNNNKFLALWAENYDGSAGDASTTIEYNYVGSHTYFRAVMRGDATTPAIHNQTISAPIFTAAQRGTWVHVRIYAAVVSVGRNLGIWIDDTLVFEITDYNAITAGGLNYLRHGYLFGWSNSGFDEEMVFEVDNWTVTREA